MDPTGSYPVKLYVYDLSRGMARQLSPVMLGKFLTSSVSVAAVNSAPRAPTESMRLRGPSIEWRCMHDNNIRVE